MRSPQGLEKVKREIKLNNVTVLNRTTRKVENDHQHHFFAPNVKFVFFSMFIIECFLHPPDETQ